MAIEIVDQAGEELIMAIGDNGYELTPRSETVLIRAFPVGPGNKCIPASIRHLDPTAKAKRILGIRCAGRQFPLVTWLDESGKRSSCCITDAEQARDPLFGALSYKIRGRIFDAAISLGL